MNTTPRKGYVLAVHPTTQGFGWAIFENPVRPVDWGLACGRRGGSPKLLRRFDRLLNLYAPFILVMEDFEDEGARRSPAIRELCRSMVDRAERRSTRTMTYHRSLIRAVFEAVGARTRNEMAHAIGGQLEALGHQVPAKRKHYEREKPRQSLFDAAALALTYFRIQEDFRL